MAYINLVEVTREYAGGEEGGRYGTVRTVLDSVRIRGGINTDRARAAFNRYIKANIGRCDTGFYARRFPGYYRDGGQIDHVVCSLDAEPAKNESYGFVRYQ
jgi:hypothetical protein